MFGKRIEIVRSDPGGDSRTRTVALRRLRFTPDGDFVGLRMTDVETEVEEIVEAASILRFRELDAPEGLPARGLEELPVPVEEVETGEPVDRRRRRAFLRTRGFEIARTAGRRLAHVPAGAVRIVYSYGVNERRSKDVFVVRMRPDRDEATVRDVTNDLRQKIAIPMILTLIDPRGDVRLQEEDEIRRYLMSYRPLPLLQRLGLGRRPPAAAA